MPDERREFHKIRPASHTLLSVNCLYQMNAAGRKGVFTKWIPTVFSLAFSALTSDQTANAKAYWPLGNLIWGHHAALLPLASIVRKRNRVALSPGTNELPRPAKPPCVSRRLSFRSRPR